jgi:hypothetical protein
VASSCECGYESSGSIKCGNFLSSSGRFSFSGRPLLHGVSIVSMPILMAERSMARVFGPSLAGIASSNPVGALFRGVLPNVLFHCV